MAQNSTIETAIGTCPSSYNRDVRECMTRNYVSKIEDESILKYSMSNTRCGEKMRLPHTGFLTVPYMGGDRRSLEHHPRLETEITFAPKSTLNVGDRNRFVPLVGCIAENIQHPQHIIPEENQDDWVRGGYPTRNCKKKTLPNRAASS